MFNHQLKFLQLRLLLSYLGVMAAILATVGLTVHSWFIRNLNSGFNNYLLELAEAAAQTLEIVQHEYYEYADGKDEDDEYYQSQDQGDRKAKNSSQPFPNFIETYGHSGQVAEVIQHPLHQRQGIEWFDDQQVLMVWEGNLAPSWPLADNLAQPNTLLEQHHIRSLILPVYDVSSGQSQELRGYIRVSQSTEWLEDQFHRLRWGLAFGGLIALGLTGAGGVWLTQQALQPIRQSFGQLKQFTADASHELRSPLTAIKNSISVLQNHPERIHPADVNKIEAIASATTQMTRLAEDLLLLARLEGTVSMVTFNQIPVPIDEILEDLLDELEQEATEQHIHLKSQLQSHLFVLADGQQLKRLFANLLKNALQYTPSGGTITIVLDQICERAMIEVKDTGMGIAPEELPYIFDRLWRSPQAKTQRQAGMGLGLAIAQTIARVHGGKISVTTELGKGSCFRVELPTTVT